MKAIYNIIIAGILGISAALFSGCGVDDSETKYHYYVKLSSLHYVKDAKVSVEEINASYVNSGSYNFDVTVSGTRVAVAGTYITDEDNESNTSLQSTLCESYLPSLNTDASSFTLQAPSSHDDYEYININPFTTLIVHGISAQELALRYPVASSIEPDFDFDVTAARQAIEYSTQENNLSTEICDALAELQSF
ncbi:MAG: hypothetical protein U9P71_07925 [Campylobacterota bacterium]|nr:hypothetical protein [Campylobacterota bacterium]